MTISQKAVNDLIEAILEKGRSDNRAELRKEQRVVYLVVELETFTCMEGLIGFYGVLGGQAALDVDDALRQIGAIRSADLIRRANASFPNGRPPLEPTAVDQLLNSIANETYAVIQEIEEQYLARHDDDIDDLINAYVAENYDKLGKNL